MPRILPVLALLAIVCLGVAIASWRVLSAGKTTPQIHNITERPQQSADAATAGIPDPGWEGVTVPDFVLVDQDGRQVTQAALDGRVTLMDYFFSDCPFVCPGLTAAMLRLSDALEGTDVQFLSVSVNPARDTPERLKDYGSRYGADFSRWRFLTGDPATVDTMVRDGLGFELRDDPERPIDLGGGETMINIVHPSHIVLVGPKREILGIYLFQFEEQLEMAEARARVLAESLRSRR